MKRTAKKVETVSAATVAMWFKIENKVKKVIAATVFNFEDRAEVLSQMMLQFFNRDGGMDGDRERSEGECVNFTCSFGMAQQASRECGFTAPHVLQGRKGENTKAKVLATEMAYQNATSNLDLKVRLQEIENRFNPRVYATSYEDWTEAGGDAIASGHNVQDLVPEGEWNENAAEFFASSSVSAANKALVRDLIDGLEFSEICTKNGVDPNTDNVPRDFRRKLEAAYRPVDRHINSEFAALGLVREARFNTAKTGTRMSAAEATGFAPSNVVFADFAPSSRPAVDLKIIDQAIVSVTALLSNECAGRAMGQVVGQ